MGNSMRIVMPFFILLLLCDSICFGQIRPGARQIALAHADVASQKNVFALFNNPASLTDLNFIQAGIFYSPAPYGLSELSTAFAAVSIPAWSGTTAAGFSVYGFELYRESSISAGYSNKVLENFSAGITAVYRNVSIKNYGSANAFILNAGFSAAVSGAISFGMFALNVTRSSIGSEGNQIPTVFCLGGTYLAGDFNINAAVEKEISSDPAFLFGAEIKPLEFIELRLGVRTFPSNFSAGIGIEYARFQFEYAVYTHTDLGLTHQAGLIFTFGPQRDSK